MGFTTFVWSLAAVGAPLVNGRLVEMLGYRWTYGLAAATTVCAGLILAKAQVTYERRTATPR